MEVLAVIVKCLMVCLPSRSQNLSYIFLSAIIYKLFRAESWVHKSPFTLRVSIYAAISIAITVWLNCLDFLIFQASRFKNGFQLRLIRYYARVDADAQNKSLMLSVNGLKGSFTPPESEIFLCTHSSPRLRPRILNTIDIHSKLNYIGAVNGLGLSWSTRVNTLQLSVILLHWWFLILNFINSKTQHTWKPIHLCIKTELK